jgi:hypothetical protein
MGRWIVARVVNAGRAHWSSSRASSGTGRPEYVFLAFVAIVSGRVPLLVSMPETLGDAVLVWPA